MTDDFKRLIDETDSDLARAVLGSGRISTGNAARKKQVLAALGVGLVIGTTNKLSMAALSTWQKVMFIGGVACVGAGGAMTYTHFASPSSVTPSTVSPVSVPVEVAEAPAVVPVEPRAVEPALAGGGAPGVEVADVGVAGVTRTAVSPVNQPVTRGGERVVRESSVKAELVMLEQARAALSGGNGNTALQVLARYGERYPRGSMRLEAEVLKVEALAASGRSAEAARLADRLLARNPKSVVASRLRRFASKD